jgi:hypothetical protein
MKIILPIILVLVIFISPISGKSEFVYKWKDDFTEAEKTKVKKWLDITFSAVKNRIGDYPFDVHLFIYRRDNQSEPCPWANTWRYPNQQVHFHIDPSFSLEEFIEDWTAPHELSHLAIPYIGERETWFSEGFASFMQYQVMEEMGLLNPSQRDSAYSAKVNKAGQFYSGNQAFGSEAMELRENNNYPAMYWGGASFFLTWNGSLEKSGTNLCQVFVKYLSCCRKHDRGVTEVVSSLDKSSGFSFGSDLLKKYREEQVEVGFEIPEVKN